MSRGYYSIVPDSVKQDCQAWRWLPMAYLVIVYRVGQERSVGPCAGEALHELNTASSFPKFEIAGLIVSVGLLGHWQCYNMEESH
jgi:hypothetical protein